GKRVPRPAEGGRALEVEDFLPAEGEREGGGDYGAFRADDLAERAVQQVAQLLWGSTLPQGTQALTADLHVDNLPRPNAHLPEGLNQRVSHQLASEASCTVGAGECTRSAISSHVGLLESSRKRAYSARIASRSACVSMV